jgi:NADH-quinone oxidoreductase subunit M
MVQSIFFNTKADPGNTEVQDLTRRESLVLIPLIVGIFWLGVYPKPFMDRMSPSLNEVIERVENQEDLGGAAFTPSESERRVSEDLKRVVDYRQTELTQVGGSD